MSHLRGGRLLKNELVSIECMMKKKNEKTKKQKIMWSSLVFCDSPKLGNNLIWNSECDPTIESITQSLLGKM